MIRFVASGNTFSLRKSFTSWAWHWDSDRGAWIEDNNSTLEWPGIQWALDQVGVNVSIEWLDESGKTFRKCDLLLLDENEF